MPVAGSLQRLLTRGLPVSSSLGKLIEDLEKAEDVNKVLGITEINHAEWLERQKEKMRANEDEAFLRAIFESKTPGTMIMLLKEGIEFDDSVPHDAEVTVALLRHWMERMRALWRDAVCGGDADLLDTWMSLGIDLMWPFTSDKVKQSLPGVFHAAAYNQRQVVATFLGHSFCLEMKDSHGRTPLCYAVRNEAVGTVEELCRSWADPTVQFDCEGLPFEKKKAPLMAVLARDLVGQMSLSATKLRIIETLVAYGALDGLSLTDDGIHFDCKALHLKCTDGSDFNVLNTLPHSCIALGIQRRTQLAEPDFEFEARQWKDPPTVKKVQSPAQLEAEKREKARKQAEKERKEAEAREKERKEAEKREQERKEAEKREQERLRQEQLKLEANRRAEKDQLQREAYRRELERREAQRRQRERRQEEELRQAELRRRQEEEAQRQQHEIARMFAPPPMQAQEAQEAQAPGARPSATSAFGYTMTQMQTTLQPAVPVQQSPEKLGKRSETLVDFFGDTQPPPKRQAPRGAFEPLDIDRNPQWASSAQEEESSSAMQPESTTESATEEQQGIGPIESSNTSSYDLFGGSSRSESYF
ncbi:MAG: hypothetical protein MHM6MM_002962 [Cercozoa sp. M6MM]